jgi:hypothetical protein
VGTNRKQTGNKPETNWEQSGNIMSRSKRKNPCMGITCSGNKAGNQSMCKSKENRTKRRKVNVILSKMHDYLFPHEKEFGNEWASPRDGKQWLKNPLSKWMRK